MITQEDAFLCGMGSCRAMDLESQNWLCGIDHTLKHGDDLTREMRQHVRYHTTEVFFD